METQPDDILNQRQRSGENQAPRMSSLSITDSQLVGLFIEAAAWGIQLVTFVLSVWTLAERARASNLRLMNPLLVYASTLFLIGTLDVSFALIQNLQMFSYDGGCSGDGIPHQPPNYVLTLRVRISPEASIRSLLTQVCETVRMEFSLCHHRRFSIGTSATA